MRCYATHRPLFEGLERLHNSSRYLPNTVILRMNLLPMPPKAYQKASRMCSYTTKLY